MASVATMPLKMSIDELDRLFTASPPGAVPAGLGVGTVVVAPGTRAARAVARFAELLVWRGKRFDAAGEGLFDLLGPLAKPALHSEVYESDSWIDHRPCIVLDYSKSSRIARAIREEIREVTPGQYLGIVFVAQRLAPLRFLLAFRPTRSNSAATYKEAP